MDCINSTNTTRYDEQVPYLTSKKGKYERYLRSAEFHHGYSPNSEFYGLGPCNLKYFDKD